MIKHASWGSDDEVTPPAPAQDSDERFALQIAQRYPSGWTTVPDAEIAAAITDDAQSLFNQRKPVELSRYLAAFPGIESRGDVLDVAIEFVIKSLQSSGQSLEDAESTLVGNYPHLATAINVAATIARGMGSTTLISGSLAVPEWELPKDFGPAVAGEGPARYRLEERLGFGSQGTVFKAVDRALSSPNRPVWVAIKVLRAASYDLELLDWTREARRARQVKHPSVVQVLDVGIDPSARTRFVVFEFIEGVSLDQWVADRDTVDARTAARIVRDICEGIATAHTRGVIHRDLKPSNVIMEHGDRPRITDFGVARDVQEQEQRSSGGDRVGSLAFMAPEQLTAASHAMPVSDVYAAGGMLFFMLTGKIPNGPTAEVAQRRLRETGTHDRFVSALRKAGVDPKLAQIIDRALSPAPDSRHGSAAALATDLSVWLDHRPVPSLAYSMPERLSMLVRRRPAAVAATTVAVLAICGLAVLAIASMIRNAETSADLRVAAAEVSSEREFREQLEASQQRMQEQVQTTFSTWRTMQQGLVDRDWISMLTMLTTLGGDGIGPDTVIGETLQRERITAAERFLTTPPPDGPMPGLERALWQMAVAVWALETGMYDIAVELAAAAHEELAELAGPEDAMTRRAMIIDVVSKSADAVLSDGTTEPDPEVARKAFLRVEHLLDNETIPRQVLNTLVRVAKRIDAAAK